MLKLPEPWGRMDQRGRLLSDNDSSGAKLFTEAQYRQGQRDALEAAAKVCSEVSYGYCSREGMKFPENKTDAETGASDCEELIRKLMEGL